MNETPMLAGNGALWVQVDGPNTKPEYLGCHDLGDIEEPQGDKTLLWCPDPSAPNKFKVVGSYKGAAGAISTSVTVPLFKTADYLETLRCPATLFVHVIECGRKDVFENWVRSFLLDDVELSSRRRSKLVARTPDEQDEAVQSFDIEAEDQHDMLPVEINRQQTTEHSSVNDVVFCNVPQCQDECGVAQDYCQEGFAVTDALAGSPTDLAGVPHTHDGGDDEWLQTVADPFLATEDIASVVCVEIGGGVTRVIVSRGTADGNPMDIAYTDDGGANWTVVVVGAVVGQYATMGGTLFALDMYHIWLGCTGGYIYFSDDGGVTWTAQHSGTLDTADINHIDFADELHGVAVQVGNTMLHTDDGGATWDLIAGHTDQAEQDILCVDVRDEYRWWLGYATDGDLYYTHDKGVTFHSRDYPDRAEKTTLPDVTFINDLVGFMIANTGAAGTVYRTINGGYSWLAITTPANSMLNAIWACHINLAYIVGEVDTSIGMFLKLAA